MPARVDLTPYGACAPGLFDRIVLRVTRRLPATWLGERLAILLRRTVTMRLKDRALDTSLWNTRMRLYPRGNGCEKMALFTPQMFDPVERNALAAAIDTARAAGREFTFVDLGANVGLYSLFVASRCGDKAHVLAIEPQPGIVDRLAYNVQLNPELPIAIAEVAAADRESELTFIINDRDSGGSHVLEHGAAPSGAVRIPCRPLAAILRDAHISAIDAMKVDIEGAESIALPPFFREWPASDLPRLIIVERREEDFDLPALLHRHGYSVLAQGRQNTVFRLK